MLSKLRLLGMIAVLVMGAVTLSPAPATAKNTAEVAMESAGGEVPFVKAEHYMRIGNQPITAAEFEADPFAGFVNTKAANAVRKLTGLSVGIENLSRDRFTRIVRGQDHEVKRKWADCPRTFSTASLNWSWFERARYKTADGVEQCLYLKGPGDTSFKAVFSLGCHNPIGAEIAAIVKLLASEGKLKPLCTGKACEPPAPPKCEGKACTPPPECTKDCTPVEVVKKKGNNGWGNGDQPAPGKSGPKNDAENNGNEVGDKPDPSHGGNAGGNGQGNGQGGDKDKGGDKGKKN